MPEKISIGTSDSHIFKSNELCIYAGVTFDEHCEVVLEVKEEEGEYPCILDMDQSQKFVLGLNDEMTWSHRDKPGRTLAYLDSGVADREGNKYVMTQEETVLSQRGDQYLKEFVVVELDNGDKDFFYNLRKYDEELEMMEDWLTNPSIDNDGCLMFDSSIRKIQGQSTELFYNLVDSSRESWGQQ